MPRGCSRWLLDVWSIRVEKLQDISREDAIAEGIVPHPDFERAYAFKDGGTFYDDPRDAYRAGWEWLNGPESWELNPWVWVVSFNARRVR